MTNEPQAPGNINPQALPQFQTDASDVSAVFANFCTARMTPEELILDFGLNTQLVPTPGEPIKLTHRVVINFYTAKRLLGLLDTIVKQVEANYGVLELDFQKRIQPPG